jgi:hypothetical protein
MIHDNITDDELIGRLVHFTSVDIIMLVCKLDMSLCCNNDGNSRYDVTFVNHGNRIVLTKFYKDFFRRNTDLL